VHPFSNDRLAGLFVECLRESEALHSASAEFIDSVVRLRVSLSAETKLQMRTVKWSSGSELRRRIRLSLLGHHSVRVWCVDITALRGLFQMALSHCFESETTDFQITGKREIPNLPHSRLATSYFVRHMLISNTQANLKDVCECP
jgi:hypothetical protein